MAAELLLVMRCDIKKVQVTLQLCKIRRITQPRFAIRQKLTASAIIRVWTYEKVGRVIRLESESNPVFLDEYGEY